MTRSRAFSAASLGARLLVGASAAVGAVALVSVAVFTPWAPLTTTPLAIDERPAAADVTLACAGGILIAGRTSADASVIDVAAGAAGGRAAASATAGSASVRATARAIPQDMACLSQGTETADFHQEILVDPVLD